MYILFAPKPCRAHSNALSARSVQIVWGFGPWRLTAAIAWPPFDQLATLDAGGALAAAISSGPGWGSPYGCAGAWRRRSRRHRGGQLGWAAGAGDAGWDGVAHRTRRCARVHCLRSQWAGATPISCWRLLQPANSKGSSAERVEMYCALSARSSPIPSPMMPPAGAQRACLCAIMYQAEARPSLRKQRLVSAAAPEWTPPT